MGLNQTLIDITKEWGRGWNKGSDEEFESQRMVDRGQRMIPVQVQQQQAMQPGVLAQARALAEMKDQMERAALERNPLYKVAQQLMSGGGGVGVPTMPEHARFEMPLPGGGKFSLGGAKPVPTEDDIEQKIREYWFTQGGSGTAEEAVADWRAMRQRQNAPPQAPNLKALTPAIQSPQSGFAQLAPLPPNPYPMVYQGVSQALGQPPLESSIAPDPSVLEPILNPGGGGGGFKGKIGTRQERYPGEFTQAAIEWRKIGQANGLSGAELEMFVQEKMTGKRKANAFATGQGQAVGANTGEAADAKVNLKGAITQKGINVETDLTNVQAQANKAAAIKTAQENVAFQPITVNTEYGPVSGPRSWVEGVVKGYADAAASGLKGEGANKYSMYKRTLEDVDNMISLYKPEYVGKGLQAFFQDVKTNFDQEMNQLKSTSKEGKYGWYGGGLAGRLSQWMSTGSPEEIAFRRSVIDATNAVIYAQSGAQINENEFARNKQAMFDIYDEPATFVPSVIAARKRFQGQMVDLFKASSTPARILEKETQNRPLPKIQGPQTAPPMDKSSLPQGTPQGQAKYIFYPSTGQIELKRPGGAQ